MGYMIGRYCFGSCWWWWTSARTKRFQGNVQFLLTVGQNWLTYSWSWWRRKNNEFNIFLNVVYLLFHDWMCMAISYLFYTKDNFHSRKDMNNIAHDHRSLATFFSFRCRKVDCSWGRLILQIQPLLPSHLEIQILISVLFLLLKLKLIR